MLAMPLKLTYTSCSHNFAKKECALSGRLIEHLVSTFGLFRGIAGLGKFARYSTLRSKTIEFWETSDAANPCMRMLIKAGWDVGRDDFYQ